MQCDSGCGDCCGIVPVTETEYRRVERYAKEHSILPLDQGVTCPFYQDNTCKVYEVRPFVCHLFGHTERMPCSRGYNVNIPERDAERLARANGLPVKVLHEMVPGFSEGMLASKAKSLVST